MWDLPLQSLLSSPRCPSRVAVASRVKHGRRSSLPDSLSPVPLSRGPEFRQSPQQINFVALVGRQLRKLRISWNPVTRAFSGVPNSLETQTIDASGSTMLQSQTIRLRYLSFSALHAKSRLAVAIWWLPPDRIICSIAITACGIVSRLTGSPKIATASCVVVLIPGEFLSPAKRAARFFLPYDAFAVPHRPSRVGP